MIHPMHMRGDYYNCHKLQEMLVKFTPHTKKRVYMANDIIANVVDRVQKLKQNECTQCLHLGNRIMIGTYSKVGVYKTHLFCPFTNK